QRYQTLRGRYNDSKAEGLQRLLSDKSKTPDELVYAMLNDLAKLIQHHLNPHPLMRLIVRSDRSVDGFVKQINRRSNRHRYARLLAHALKNISHDHPDLLERVKNYRGSGPTYFNYSVVVDMLDDVHAEEKNIR